MHLFPLLQHKFHLFAGDLYPCTFAAQAYAEVPEPH